MRTILATLVAIIFAAGLTAAAEIKSTTKLQITVPGAESRSRDITDPRVLALSHVYIGAFIGQPVEVPNYQTIYNVTFDIQTLEGIKAAAYVVQYAVDANGQAFVYLPGRGEPAHRRNIATILRNGQDGRWHRASAEWSSAIQPYLP